MNFIDAVKTLHSGDRSMIVNSELGHEIEIHNYSGTLMVYSYRTCLGAFSPDISMILSDTWEVI